MYTWRVPCQTCVLFLKMQAPCYCRWFLPTLFDVCNCDTSTDWALPLSLFFLPSFLSLSLSSVGTNVRLLVDRPDGSYCFRFHKDRYGGGQHTSPFFARALPPAFYNNMNRTNSNKTIFPQFPPTPPPSSRNCRFSLLVDAITYQKPSCVKPQTSLEITFAV